MIVALPLFQNAELDRLKKRRAELLRSIEKMRHTPGRTFRAQKLREVTAAILKIENELRGRHH